MKKILLLSYLVLIMAGIQVSPALASVGNDRSKNSFVFSVETNSCIAGIFEAREDDWTGKLALWSNCTFKFVEREGREINTTEGTYSIDGDVASGQIATITFYVNGRNYGQATIAWPLEEGLQVWMNGYTFTKI